MVICLVKIQTTSQNADGSLMSMWCVNIKQKGFFLNEMCCFNPAIPGYLTLKNPVSTETS